MDYTEREIIFFVVTFGSSIIQSCEMLLRFIVAVTSLDLFYFVIGDLVQVCINMKHVLNCPCLNNTGRFVWISNRAGQIAEDGKLEDNLNHTFYLEPRNNNCYNLFIKQMNESLQDIYTCTWGGKLYSARFELVLKNETDCRNTSDKDTVTYLDGKDTNITSSTETFQLDTVHYYLLGCLGVVVVMLMSIKMLSIWKSGRCDDAMNICNQAASEQSQSTVEAIQLQGVTAESEEDNPYTEID